MVLLFILCALFASTFLISASALVHAGLFFFISVRMLVAGSVLLAYYYWKAGAFTLKKPSDWRWFLLIGIALIFLPFAAECFALQYVPAAHVSLIWSLEPFATAFYSWLLFGEYLTRRKIIGWFLGFSGIVSLLIQTHGRENELMHVWHFSLADLLLMACVIMTAFAWITFKRLLHAGYSSVFINGVVMLIGGVLATITSLAVESWHPVPISPISLWPYVMGAAFSLILISNIAAYNLYGHLLKQYSATLLAFSCSVLIPLFTVLFDFIIFHRAIGWDFMARLVVVWLGLYLFYSKDKQSAISVADHK